MARLLAIDWDHDQFQLVAVGTTRKGVAVEKALAWPLGEELTVQNGEALGRKLRDALKAAGIAPAPVVACVGRERVVIKELRYPPVPPAEEAALVRFQAAKELSELPDEVVIDYAPLSAPNQPGERQALAVALKKSTATSWLALCRGLGVKLAALTPRPQALLGAVARAQAEGHAPSGETLAIVAVGSRWAELSILHQGRVLFARSLAVGPALAGEIKRNLHVFSTTNAAVQAPVAVLLTGRIDAELEQRLRESDLPGVQRLDPCITSESIPAAQKGALAAPLGAAYQWARTESLPINFAAPKQSQANADPVKRRKVLWVAAAAVLFVGIFLFANRTLAARKAKIVELAGEKAQRDDDYKKMAQERLDVEALKEWEATTISWLDEVYDLTARVPHQIGFRIKDLSAGPISKRGGKGANYVAQISFNGIAKTTQDGLVIQLIDSINSDKYLRATPARSQDRGNGNQEFQIKIDVAKRPTDHYRERFTAVPRPKTAPVMEPDDLPDPPDDPPEKGGAPEKGGVQ